MTIEKPKALSDEHVQKGVQLVKTQRPDLWSRWVNHERQNEGYDDISQEIGLLIKEHFGLQGGQLTVFRSQLRREARREAGQPI